VCVCMVESGSGDPSLSSGNFVAVSSLLVVA
jgi:hypothetical protein